MAHAYFHRLVDCFVPLFPLVNQTRQLIDQQQTGEEAGLPVCIVTNEDLKPVVYEFLSSAIERSQAVLLSCAPVRRTETCRFGWLWRNTNTAVSIFHMDQVKDGVDYEKVSTDREASVSRIGQYALAQKENRAENASVQAALSGAQYPTLRPLLILRTGSRAFIDEERVVASFERNFKAHDEAIRVSVYRSGIISDTAAAFADHNAYIGVHGAAFANLIFGATSQTLGFEISTRVLGHSNAGRACSKHRWITMHLPLQQFMGEASCKELQVLEGSTPKDQYKLTRDTTGVLLSEADIKRIVAEIVSAFSPHHDRQQTSMDM